MNLFEAEQELYDLIHGYYLIMARSEEPGLCEGEREVLRIVAHSLSRLYYHLEDELREGYQAAAFRPTGGKLLIPRAERIARSEFPDRERRLREGRERQLEKLKKEISEGRFKIISEKKS